MQEMGFAFQILYFYYFLFWRNLDEVICGFLAAFLCRSIHQPAQQNHDKVLEAQYFGRWPAFVALSYLQISWQVPDCWSRVFYSSGSSSSRDQLGAQISLAQVPVIISQRGLVLSKGGGSCPAQYNFYPDYLILDWFCSKQEKQVATISANFPGCNMSSILHVSLIQIWQSYISSQDPGKTSYCFGKRGKPVRALKAIGQIMEKPKFPDMVDGEFRLVSPAFLDGGELHRNFTGDGLGDQKDISPLLEWYNGPEGTVSLPSVMDEPIAPDPGDPIVPYVHLVVINIPPTLQGFSAGFSTKDVDEEGEYAHFKLPHYYLRTDLQTILDSELYLATAEGKLLLLIPNYGLFLVNKIPTAIVGYDEHENILSDHECNLSSSLTQKLALIGSILELATLCEIGLLLLLIMVSNVCTNRDSFLKALPFKPSWFFPRITQAYPEAEQKHNLLQAGAASFAKPSIPMTDSLKSRTKLSETFRGSAEKHSNSVGAILCGTSLATVYQQEMLLQQGLLWFVRCKLGYLGNFPTDFAQAGELDNMSYNLLWIGQDIAILYDSSDTQFVQQFGTYRRIVTCMLQKVFDEADSSREDGSAQAGAIFIFSRSLHFKQEVQPQSFAQAATNVVS